MALNTKIEWCHASMNLWHGCTKVHEGCDNCYAETLSHRWGRDIWGNDKPRLEIKSVWKDLAKQQKLAAAAGEMHRVFVGSMMDIFEKPMPLVDSKGNSIQYNTHTLRRTLFGLIASGAFSNLLFLFLTKRPSNINKYIPETWKTNPPENVMFGTSPVNQATADKLIPQLLQVKGRKFLSIEPMLGPVDLRLQQRIEEAEFRFDHIDWVICGGESGHGARPMHPDWARSLRDQCATAGVPFFFKQWGEHQEGSAPNHPNITVLTNGWNDNYGQNPPTLKDWNRDEWHALNPVVMSKVGKKAAGRLLDGVEHNAFPEPMNQNFQTLC